jgi:CspA family cold shock protein
MRNGIASALVAFGSLLPCKGRAANLRSTNRDLAEDWAAALDRAHAPDDIPKHRHSSSRGADALWLAFMKSRDKESIMATGTVKWYNETKGYGFIQPDNGGKDVFVHATALERAGLRGLAEGQKVSYDVEADRRTGKESAGNLKTA